MATLGQATELPVPGDLQVYNISLYNEAENAHRWLLTGTDARMIQSGHQVIELQQE